MRTSRMRELVKEKLRFVKVELGLQTPYERKKWKPPVVEYKAGETLPRALTNKELLEELMAFQTARKERPELTLESWRAEKLLRELKELL